MYKWFRVSNFRCFRELTVADLERVNLIAGVNNVGKTALLEALFLHCGAYNPELVRKLSLFRGIGALKFELGRWGEMPWDSLLWGADRPPPVAEHSNLAYRRQGTTATKSESTHFVSALSGDHLARYRERCQCAPLGCFSKRPRCLASFGFARSCATLGACRR